MFLQPGQFIGPPRDFKLQLDEFVQREVDHGITFRDRCGKAHGTRKVGPYPTPMSSIRQSAHG